MQTTTDVNLNTHDVNHGVQYFEIEKMEDKKPLPVWEMKNVHNKLAADVFVHIAAQPTKPQADMEAQEFLIKSIGMEPFKAKIVDYWKGFLFELPQAMIFMATGLATWEDADRVIGKNSPVAFYYIQKVK